MRASFVAVLAVVALVVGCGDYNTTTYQPPDLSSDTSGLIIDDDPLNDGDSEDGNFPSDDRFLGYVFRAEPGEVFDIVLERTAGNDVPALALYQFRQDGWSETLAWATADAREIGIRGWQAPIEGTYLVLVDLVAGPGTGTFKLTLSCTEGCGDPRQCSSDADCAAGEVCWNGLCFEDEIECRSDSDCAPHEMCENGFCVLVCNPSPEVCDGLDNDCDGIVDEDCNQRPCTNDAECAPDEMCMNGVCVAFCGCHTDADCPMGFLCIDCQCVADDCPDDDGDGFNTCRGDCDDANPTVFPGAQEACDQIDNDCDGVVDEGCGGLPCTSDADCPAGNDECAPDEMCVNGICQAICVPAVEVCDGVDNDCDGLVDEGCGCANGADCAAGEACCANVCVDVLFDDNNCGACGQACAQGESCERGVCVPDTNPCSTNSDCDDGDPNTYDYCYNGVCHHEWFCQTDADCPAGQMCIDGMCMYDPCPDDDGDGYTTCDGDCVDYDARIHPGAAEDCDGLDNDCDGQVDEGCSNPCSADSQCAAGQMCCAGVCIDPLFDDNNCGGCGQVCAAGESCERGACVPACDCASDADCPQGYICLECQCVYDGCTDADGDGFCQDSDCDDNNASVHPGAPEICGDSLDNDCDGQIDEGCGGCQSNADCSIGLICCANECVNIANDVGNCGACGMACAAGEACYDGVCIIACTTDADCDDGNPNTSDYCVNGVCVHR
jgi:Cys-rich repeat protein